VSERNWFLDYARYWPRQPPTLICDPFTRDPHDVMEELRRDDPDAHALLSEHLVLPPAGERQET
jgi:hypothetical protein